MDLTQTCRSRKGESALDSHTIASALAQIPEWQYKADSQQIFRQFHFNNYYETIAFVNAIAWIANQQNHHPDLAVHYKTCQVYYSTHEVGGISENDFICAYQINQLV